MSPFFVCPSDVLDKCDLHLKVKLIRILIYSDSSGTPGSEEEGESKKDQQKVSVFWGVMPQTLRHCAFFVVVAAAPACLSQTENGGCMFAGRSRAVLYVSMGE